MGNRISFKECSNIFAKNRSFSIAYDYYRNKRVDE